MIDGKFVTAIILAAGNSKRYGKNRNKNFEIIKNKTVLEYSLHLFDVNEYVDEIIVATKSNEEKIVEEIITKAKYNKSIKIAIGGNERKESVYNCIRNTNAEIVIIHDGARPMIKQEYINKCIKSMSEFKGVTIGVKTKDTIKITDEDGIVMETTKRSNTWLIQTPQCFDRKVLLEMYEKYKEEQVTDDCKLLENGNYKIKVIEGDYTNIKITTYEDLNIAREFLEENL